MLYPQDIRCVVCGKELFEDNKYGICSGCSLKANVRFCPKCGRAIASTEEYCENCKNEKHYFTLARAPFVYEGKAKKLVHRLKYGGAEYLASNIAYYLADEYNKYSWNADIVTFVPMHPKRMKSRGYNQAQLIVKKLSEIIKIPMVETLKRIKFSTNFARMSRRDRIKEAEDSFEAIDRFKNKVILLVDDVFTTGATTDACSKELLRSGAKEVYVLTFCTSVCTIELY